MIRVTVEFFRPAFHGLREHGEVEWPPSPVRLLGALKSGAHMLEDPDTASLAHAALARVAAAPPPIIRTPTHRRMDIPDTFTERTWVPDRLSTKHEERADRALSLDRFGLDSRSRERKPQNGVALDGTSLAYDIPVELTGPQAHALDEAAARVPYFGRSHDPAALSVRGVSDDSGEAPTGFAVTWFPLPHATGTSRSWTPDTIPWMDANHARVFSEDPPVRSLAPLPDEGYVRRLRYALSPAGDSATAPEIAVIPLGRALDHHRVPWAMRLLHEAAPEEWGFLPLTSSGHHHADGRLVGVAVWDRQTGDLDRFEALAELGEALQTVERRAQGPQPGTSSRALSADHWVRPSRVWQSTTPLRGFPDLRVLSYQLRHECAERWGTDAVLREAAAEPVHPWHGKWRNSDYTDGLGQWWLTIEFGRPVTGPLLLGASQADGFGAFRPLPESGVVARSAGDRMTRTLVTPRDAAPGDSTARDRVSAAPGSGR